MNEKSFEIIEPFLNRPIKAGDKTVLLGFALRMKDLACPADSSIKDKDSSEIEWIEKSLDAEGSLTPEESNAIKEHIRQLKLLEKNL